MFPLFYYPFLIRLTVKADDEEEEEVSFVCKVDAFLKLQSAFYLLNYIYKIYMYYLYKDILCIYILSRRKT